MLARAFDRACRDRDYETALPLIEEWLSDPCPNVRRAVTEGLRVWTQRPWFRDRPEGAIRFLAGQRAEPSRYLHTSAGNALRDISRTQPALVAAELATWDLDDPNVAFTHRLAAKFLDKP